MASVDISTEFSKTYTGSCHCKAVQYTVTTSPPIEDSKVIDCNCSICTERGALVFFATSDNLTITGEESLSEPYMFNKKQIRYRFCKNCGSHLLGHNEEKTQYGINARTLNNIDYKALKTLKIDGASQ